jgi:hypothetical protein
MFRIYVLLLLTTLSVSAQIRIESAVGAIGNSGDAPFLLKANRYGVVPVGGNIGYLNTRISKNYDTTSRDFDYGFAFEPHVNLGKTNAFLLPEAYAKARWKALEVYGGRRREVVGLVDTLLTSGSYIWSGNSLPLWKIQAGIPEYTTFFKQNLVAVKGAIAHGWFDQDRPVTKNVLLHQKWIYVRVGKPQWKAKIHAGFNHHVQWGGESPFYSVDGKLPSGMANFPHVFFGTRNPDTSAPIGSFDGENRIGNHLGTADLALDLSTGFGSVMIYRQSIYEDGSLLFLNNISDGLNGLTINLNNPSWVSRINFEYLQTSSQGGPVFISGDGIPGELRGRDNYFNHAQYRDGWTYKSRILGTPYIQTVKYAWDDPEYQIDQNRVKMVQLAIMGNLPFELTYRLKGAHATYFGTYQFPEEKKTLTSYLLDVQRPIDHRSSVRVQMAFDTGKLLPRSAGIQVIYVRSWQ